MTPPTSEPATFSADLDHVAIAVERQAEVWPRYVGELGAEWVAGGRQAGFAPAQVRFAGGMRLEVLEPHDVERNDFLRRFLDRSGPGAHHLTFKVSDLTAALDGARQLGMTPVGVDRRDPDWQEAFLHPKEAFGIVVQLAQAGRAWASPAPPDLPPVQAGTPAVLTHLVLSVPDLDPAARLFRDLLGGGPAPRFDEPLTGGAEALDLAWDGPGRVRLLRPAAGSPEADRLAGRPGTFDHLAFSAPDPGGVEGARALRDGRWEVPAELNHGVRLTLSAAG